MNGENDLTTQPTATAIMERLLHVEARLSNEMNGRFERFEASLSSLRADMQTNAVALREEIQTNAVVLREEIHLNAVVLREEIQTNAVVLREEIQSNAVALREEMHSNAVALRGDIEKNAVALHAMLEKEAGFLRDELSLKLALFAIKIECLNDNILDLRSQQRAILRLLSKWEEKAS